MPKKSFFSGSKQEDNTSAKDVSADDSMFETDFDGMQPLDMFADEANAADGFAALLQPEDGDEINDMNTEFSFDAALPQSETDGQNVGEAVFNNFFGEEDAAPASEDFFAAQPTDFGDAAPLANDDFFAGEPMNFGADTPDGGMDDFFAAQPTDFDDAAPLANDDFFAAQPTDFDDAAPLASDDFFAAQPADMSQPFTDATFAADTVQGDDFFLPPEDDAQPYTDAAFAAPADFGAPAQPVEAAAQDIPFDIAVPEQPVAQEELAQNTEGDTAIIPSGEDADYVPKRKYAPVFTQPIPSALDELRAGLVKPASPISSIAATQIPVVVTAAEAAAAEAAAKIAAEQAAAEAAAAEAAAKIAAEQAAAEAEAAKYGYEEPAPEETQFGYTAPAETAAFGYEPTSEQPLDPTGEFVLPVTEDVPEQQWQMPVENPQAPAQSAVFDFESAPVQDAAPVDAARAPMFDFDNAPLEAAPLMPQDAAPVFDFDSVTEQDTPESLNDLDFGSLADPAYSEPAAYDDAFMPENETAAQTPEDYANNLQAMFADDASYAALDDMQPSAAEAPVYEDAPYDAAPLADAPYEDAAYGDEAVDYGAQAGLPQDSQQAEDSFSDFDGGFSDLELTEEDAQSTAPSFNPFESEEWLGSGDEDEADEKPVKKLGRRMHGSDDEDQYSYDDGNGGDDYVAPKTKKSNGGNGGGSKLPLWITLIVLVLAIVGVLVYLLVSGAFGKQPVSSSVSIVESVSIPESIPVVEEPVVDPIPRDEWYMKLVNKENALTADFTVDTANCSDGIAVDSRIVEALNQLIADGNATGLKLFVAGGYRSYEKQKTNYDYQVNLQLAAGKSQTEAEAAAAEITAPAGASEHNLGLAVDIMSKNYTNYDAGYADTDEAKWLLDHAADYGFILRYSQTSQSITGFEFEPWHYRYVGVDQAQRIKASGLTLEEYLAQDAPTGIPETAPAADTTADSTPEAEASSASSQAAA